MIIQKTINVFHLCCGVGAGARGFQKGKARVGNLEAVSRCLGGVDNDAGAIRAFERKTGVKGTVLDLFSRWQYTAVHGHEPPADWAEATPQDLQRAAQNEHPHVVFMSFPCKGNSGLLSETKAKTDKYQALNSLAERGLMLALEAWKDDPVELFIFENVPRIAQRSRKMLDRCVALLHAYGYAVAETKHCCGRIGGLGQRRERFLLVARHMEKVPGFLYQPRLKPYKTVGQVLEKLPLPGDPAAGPMHRIPQLQWKTWVRLAMIEAGKDWRSLNSLRVEDGFLADFQIVPEEPLFNDALGVTPWSGQSGVVSTRAYPYNGKFAVADPRRPEGASEYQQYGVIRMEETASAVSGKAASGSGPYNVADPRQSQRTDYKQNKYRVTRHDETAGAVIGASTTGNGAFAVADPRAGYHSGKTHQSVLHVHKMDDVSKTVTGSRAPYSGGLSIADPRPGYGPQTHHNVLQVHRMEDTAKTISGANHPAGGALSIADPRPVALSSPERAAYLTGGHYGVAPWDSQSGAVPAYAKNNNGPWSVADPRIDRLPAPEERLVAVIRALDGTWHRPFTTLDLAALQSMIDPELPGFLWLDGNSDSQWREWIGNAVPEDAAEAMAGEFFRCLLLVWSGQTFILSDQDIWVQPFQIALSLAQGAAP